MLKSRREFIKAAGKYTFVGVTGGILERTGSGIFKTLFEDKEVGEVEKEALEILFNKNSPPSLYPGKGNPLGLLDNGVQKLSSYLEFSSENFSNYISKALGIKTEICKNNNCEEFNYNQFESALFLGGPVANNIVKDLLGYTDVTVQRNGEKINMPVPNMADKRVRWGQLHGESGYGVYNGKLELAKRYSQGALVERAIYKLKDKNDNSILTPTLDRNGFLETEWLTIVKLKEFDTTKVIIGGMHGYSTEAFAKKITKNLEHLAKLTKKIDQYQVIIPVNLIHRKNLRGIPTTSGELNWKAAKIQEIS